VEAAEQLRESLARGSFRRIGLGAANARRFLFHCGLGLDAAVISQVERRSFLKRYGAHALFVASTVDTWLRHYDRRRPRFRVELENGELVGESAFAIVSNQRPWTYLGKRPIMIAPDAGLDVPLTVTLFRSLELPVLLSGAALALRGGRRLARHPKVTHRSHLYSLSAAGYGPFPWQVDGDYMGETEHLDFTWEQDALTIVTPS
jgi:diacylglycerol kinase family enzyme